MTPVAPRILSGRFIFVTRINHQCHLSWQAHYLVKGKGDSCCCVHCTGRFMCDEDQSTMPFLMEGPIFGEVGG